MRRIVCNLRTLTYFRAANACRPRRTLAVCDILHEMRLTRELFAMVIANWLPRCQFFDRHRWLALRVGGCRVSRATIWAPFDVRPFGSLVNLSIGEGTFINAGFRCGVPDGALVVIGRDCAIGPNVSLETVNHGLRFDPATGWTSKRAGIEIQDRVWIGSGSILLPGVIVGHDSVIAAGSVVTRSLPPFSLVAGVPAKLVRNLACDKK